MLAAPTPPQEKAKFEWWPEQYVVQISLWMPLALMIPNRCDLEELATHTPADLLRAKAHECHPVAATGILDQNISRCRDTVITI